MGPLFAIPFVYLPEVMTDFRQFLLKHQKGIIREREESDIGEMVRRIFKVAGQSHLTTLADIEELEVAYLR